MFFWCAFVHIVVGYTLIPGVARSYDKHRFNLLDISKIILSIYTLNSWVTIKGGAVKVGTKKITGNLFREILSSSKPEK